MNLEYLIKGSSVFHSLPTLLYLGFFRRKNRINLLKDPSGISDFASIPYESIIIGVLIAYGVSLKLLKKLNKRTNKEESLTNSLINASIVGSVTGLIFSLTGRFVFDLPSKHFGITERPWMVHIVAPILYAIIFIIIEKAEFFAMTTNR